MHSGPRDYKNTDTTRSTHAVWKVVLLLSRWQGQCITLTKHDKHSTFIFIIKLYHIIGKKTSMFFLIDELNEIMVKCVRYRLCNRMTLPDHQKSVTYVCVSVRACTYVYVYASSSSHYLGSLQVRAQQAIWTGDPHPAAHYSPHRKLRIKASDVHGW